MTGVGPPVGADRNDANEGDQLVPDAAESFGSAVGWSFAMNIAQMSSTLGTAFVLAGLLGPEAYGTVALALIFIAMLQVLTEQGIGPALIQRRVLTRRHLDTAFWLTLMSSILLAGTGVALSGWWAGLNDAPAARPAIQVLSILVIAKGMTVVQEALIERQLQYRSLAIRTTIASALGAAAGVGYAIVDATLWALVVQQIVTSVVGVFVLWATIW